MNKPFTIGITGGSGSGKTYFLQYIFTPRRKACEVKEFRITFAFLAPLRDFVSHE